MTNDKKTEEQKRQEQLEKQRNVAKDTLESGLVQKVLGGANVKSNPFQYGQLGLNGGEQTYADAKSSEDFGKRRGEMYQKSLQNRDSRNPEEPQISDYDVIQSYIRQVDEGSSILTLKELEGIVGGLVKKTGSSLEYEVPEQLKQTSYLDIMQKAVDEKTGKVDESKLSEDDKYALTAHQYLTDAYNKACGLKAASINYFADTNAALKEISEKYKTSEEKSE